MSYAICGICLSGLFSEVGLKFVDEEEGREGEPTLAEMTGKAVEMLSKVGSLVLSSKFKVVQGDPLEL